MKTKTTYPERAIRTKAILIAAIISIQASLMAGDSSAVKKEYYDTFDSYSTNNEMPGTLNAGNAFSCLNEEATETDMEIEDWMCTVYLNYPDANTDEEEIELEEWMYNTQHSFWKDLTETQEPELVIEDWMTNPDEWLDAESEIVLTSK